MAIREINNYDVAYYGGAKNISGHPYRAIIGLRDQDNMLLGAAYFHHSAATMPNSDTQKANGYISCHYPAEHYGHIIDLLRNEKPVFIEFEVAAGNVANIRTSSEPVGEGENSASD